MTIFTVDISYCMQSCEQMPLLCRSTTDINSGKVQKEYVKQQSLCVYTVLAFSHLKPNVILYTLARNCLLNRNLNNK